VALISTADGRLRQAVLILPGSSAGEALADRALIDELAHKSVPGAGPREKRRQDVLDILAAGGRLALRRSSRLPANRPPFSKTISMDCQYPPIASKK
jgi:hypothetical protein